MTKTDKSRSETIALTIAQRDIRFEESHTAYGRYIDTVGRGRISQASRNFLFETVHPDDREPLRDVLENNPGAAVQIAAELSSAVAPEIEVAVKKP